MRLLPQASARMSENSVRPSKNVGRVAHRERRPALRRPSRSRASRTSGGASLGEVPCDAGTRAAAAARGSRGCPRRGLEHPSSSVRLDLDEPVALEPDQRFADGRLGDAELGSRCAPRRAARRARARRRRSRRADARRRGARAAPERSSRAQTSVMHRASYLATRTSTLDARFRRRLDCQPSYLISDPWLTARDSTHSSRHRLVDVDDAVQLTREIVRIPSVAGRGGGAVRLPVPADATHGLRRVYLQEALAGSGERGRRRRTPGAPARPSS